jgi:hypothetical protein
MGDRQEPLHAEQAAMNAAMREALRRDWRAEPLALAIRGASLVVGYGLLARAIADHALPVALVLAPVAAEILVVMWLGVLLARRFVDCAAFRRDAHGLFAPVFWTVLIGGGYTAWLAFDPAAGELSLAHVPSAIVAATRTAFDSGALWAVLALLGGLVAGTVIDVRRWRVRGGVFFWGQTIGGGLRLLLMIFGFPLLAMLGAAFGAFALETWPALLAIAPAWWAFGLLALLDLGVLALAVGMQCVPERPPAAARPAA